MYKQKREKDLMYMSQKQLKARKQYVLKKIHREETIYKDIIGITPDFVLIDEMKIEIKDIDLYIR